MIARAFPLAVLVMEGCATATFTAQSSVTPVLIGPVHRVGSTGSAPSKSASSFTSEASNEGRIRIAHSTPDWDVWQATQGDPRKHIVLREVSCGSWAFYLLTPTSRLGDAGAFSDCSTDGEVRFLEGRIPLPPDASNAPP